MRNWIGLCAAGLLAAWGVGGASALDPAADACFAHASDEWKTADATYLVEAYTHGPDCDHAVAMLIVRDGVGEVAWMEVYNTAQVMVLAGMGDAEQMSNALAQWITQKDAMLKTADQLPAWAAGTDAPAGGEFPFYVEPEFDRDMYEDARTRKLPLFCIVQGMESLACLTRWPDSGVFVKLGVQSFPG